jgi:hypothetical protein
MSNIVAVDFDGVLHDFSAGWTGYIPEGDPLPGAQQFIADIISAGLTPVIHSARADCAYAVDCINAWLAQWGFPALRVTCKLSAVAYVDDRAVHCDPIRGQGFPTALGDVLRLSGLAAATSCPQV